MYYPTVKIAMEGEELGGTFVVAVDELGLSGLWATVREVRCCAQW